MGKVSKDKRDIYYRLAKQKGYRSRSAFKILQINDYFNIFENVKYVVDLCSAPGGWTQVACNYFATKTEIKDFKVISVDLQEMAEIEGADILVGDITRQETLESILNLAENNLIDIVMCDGAPDVTGFNEFDVHIQSQLILCALNISLRMLKEGGTFITKIFKGKHTNKILQILKNFFKKISIAKPKACRNATFESFLVCENYFINYEMEECVKLRKGELTDNDIIMLNSLYKEDFIDLDKLDIQFIQVGSDEYDSDKTYDLLSTNYSQIINPLQMPINPPYKFFIDNLKGK